MKLRVGYLISGFFTGFILLASFFWSLPDGKLHVVFCDVGQGDAVYVRFPDGRDMVIDGGPNEAVLQCLGRHMPFWDRHINIVAMSHPQKDHMQGLVSIFGRFSVDYFIRSDVDNIIDGYKQLMQVIKDKKIPIRYVQQYDRITIGPTTLSLVWPSSEQVSKGKVGTSLASDVGITRDTSVVLGAALGELNDYSLVFSIRYGSFDVLFPGDADMHVEDQYIGTKLADDTVELLKVPHHGSRTGMTEGFVQWLKPKLAVISVGKNSYGHPSKEAVDMLQKYGSRVLRTDQKGDIEVVSDGTSWRVY
ncbi:hypothetical protein A2Z00_05610 [Candidatus Gottesmanbacteria bacterium RBG_13_45_10]|uniref:Metallo-beta-lactamase domain-containing protein n=1 Tax=Candidatus Gottesmanbacteria bacterium RBG_13_45_10 TaxID=1798370 RepID=A0A1F5ZGB2_9BACT|nr:MAG: hypothetical protein A2Z00_05610 [Candidatus Gottesmanbacteria bacterium RBG_13_45_10]